MANAFYNSFNKPLKYFIPFKGELQTLGIYNQIRKARPDLQTGKTGKAGCSPQDNKGLR